MMLKRGEVHATLMALSLLQRTNKQLTKNYQPSTNFAAHGTMWIRSMESMDSVALNPEASNFCSIEVSTTKTIPFSLSFDVTFENKPSDFKL